MPASLPDLTPPPGVQALAQTSTGTSSTASDTTSTSELAAKVRNDPAELASFDPLFTFFKGGLAAFKDGRRVGAVGVSGLAGDDDEALARGGIEAAQLSTAR